MVPQAEFLKGKGPLLAGANKQQMNVRKLGLIKFVAGAGIFAAFAQASALQSVMGGGISLFSLLGPPLCLFACLMGFYEMVTGTSFKRVAQAFAKQSGRVKIALAIGLFIAFRLAMHLLSTFLTSPYAY